MSYFLINRLPAPLFKWEDFKGFALNGYLNLTNLFLKTDNQKITVQ